MVIATRAAHCAKLCRSGTEFLFAWALPEVYGRPYPCPCRSCVAWPSYRGGRFSKHGAANGACRFPALEMAISRAG